MKQRPPSSATKSQLLPTYFNPCTSHSFLLNTLRLAFECSDFFLVSPKTMTQSEPVPSNRTCPAAPHYAAIRPQYSQPKIGDPLFPFWLLLALSMCSFILGVLLLAFLFLVRPSAANYYVENACLTEFNLTGKSLLQYDLKLDVSITNPNKKFQVYYQQLEASANYDGEMIGWVLLPTFRLGHKKTVTIHPVFGGQSAIGLNLSVNEFMRQRSDGFFRINVEIHAKLIDSFGLLTTEEFSESIWCGLMVPLMPSNSSASGNGGFTRTECKVKGLY